ncbi:uncharacterized protein LOC110709375 [Chenopodium quinoa]|uniref:uncharacterized protein LOC110709375 n=1 Tax=Chenopodium quinoa TaxID=63459 RepID=UPI000B78C30F|nr:uncharacterized protein LOC110709375 [Chenopodium quinoa]
MIHGRLIKDKVDSIGEKFYFDGHYEISNALIKPMPRHFEIAITNNPYQLTFIENTLVQPTCSISGEVEPEFEAISAIAKAHFLDEICGMLHYYLHYLTFLFDICYPYITTHMIQEKIILNAELQPTSPTAYDICEDATYVLFAEKEVRLVDSFYGQKAYVREVVITDQT